MTAVRRTSVEKFLTPKLKDRLRTEMADPKKRKERDAGSSLLAAALDEVNVLRINNGYKAHI